MQFNLHAYIQPIKKNKTSHQLTKQKREERQCERAHVIWTLKLKIKIKNPKWSSHANDNSFDPSSSTW